MGIDKEFADVQKQVSIQISRNLAIEDHEYLKECLLSYNYFDVFNGFESLFLIDRKDKQKGYRDGTTFSDFLNLYNLDIKLNTEILHSLMHLEKKLKAQISYHFCKKFCQTIANTLNYQKASFYDCPAITSYSGKYLLKQFTNNTFVFFSNYDTNGKKDSRGALSYADIKKKISYIGAYNNPPLWVIIKQLTFNDLFVMTGLLKKPVLDEVLNSFSLTPGDRDYFLNCLDIFKDLRNHCAHFELINRYRTPGDVNLRSIGSHHTITPDNSNSAGDIYRIRLFDRGCGQKVGH